MRGDTRSRHFAEQFRVIVPDLRGYGASQKPASGYDKKTMARDIRELMVCLGIERAAIIGHDRGARVGLHFAKDIPDDNVLRCARQYPDPDDLRSDERGCRPHPLVFPL